MDQSKLDLESLDEAQYLPERMLELAERSVDDDCQDAERARLQKGFELLRVLSAQAIERYQRGRTTE